MLNFSHVNSVLNIEDKLSLSSKILSDITIFMKYSKFRPELGRRETWYELVSRNKEMHQKKYPFLKKEIEENYKFVYEKKILPSMRSLQFGGKPIEISPNRIFNCAYCPIDDWRSFGEIMFLLLGGTGVGFSVQKHHTAKLPEIRKPNKNKNKRFLIGDSIEGWADAVKYLIKSYFFSSSKLVFDYSDIRPKGAKLITSGGKAPGPEPLKICLTKIESLLEQKEDCSQLSTLEIHDIVCHIADAVLAGGIRRAALISFFSADDEEMISCKFGNWWELNPQRARANNSAVLLRHKITKEFFFSLWDKIKNSNAGEPGIFFSNDKEILSNPCNEISLRPYQFCNLCELNVSNVENQEDLDARAKAASFIGTLQAGYTDFHYLIPIWKKTTEKDALLGIGMTGVASQSIQKYDIEKATKVIIEENKRISKLIGINPAARTTCIKPSGTSSLVLGCSSGIHAWHNDYYIRRIRVGKNEAIYQYIFINHPELMEDDYFRPHDTAIISIPQKAPENSILRDETPIELLERVKEFHNKWIKPGHIKGNNTHNISATISIKENEWEDVGNWMWENKKFYNGLSVLPFDYGTYKQPPFEDCSKEQYEYLMKPLMEIDLKNVLEIEDNTDLKGEISCSGGACQINSF